MKQCARCSKPLAQRRQATICSECSKIINAKESKARPYTAGELAEALSVLPLEQKGWPVKVGNTWGGPDERLVIEACSDETRPYIWIGDPDL